MITVITYSFLHIYKTQVQIHDGPYNDIKNWDYAGFIDVINCGEGNGLGLKAKTPAELSGAIDRASKHDGVCTHAIYIVIDIWMIQMNSSIYLCIRP